MVDKTRRRLLTGAGALIAGSIAGCTDMEAAMQDLSIIQHDRLPTRESTLENDMMLSGWRLDCREGAEAHTLDIARYSPDGEWFLDVVDLVNWDGPDGDQEGDRASYVNAEDLAEGSTVVLLAAHNDQGTVVSPDAQNNSELNALLPD